MLENQVLPAIIAQNQEELDRMLTRIMFANNIMLDLMDGEFVDSISLDFPMKLPYGKNYQLHMMTNDPLNRIKNIPQQINTIILHIETLDDIERAIKRVRNDKYKIFIALNPKTPLKILKPYVEIIDGALIMTVTPGQYGAQFLPKQLEKVRKLREISNTLNIEVDGGMTDKTIGLAISAGANMVASGSFIMKSSNPKEAYDKLRMFFK
jgi:ribulose-phosphate 3-epimerase